MKNHTQKVNIFWFRRDLRLSDNHGLHQALNSSIPVIPIFIFDQKILDELPIDDARVNFIYDNLEKLNKQLKQTESSLLCLHGTPEKIWSELVATFEIASVYTNEDYEPYAIQRDLTVKSFLASKNITFYNFKDQVIFEKKEVVKKDGLPYTVYTPYKNKWRNIFYGEQLKDYKVDLWNNYYKFNFQFPTLAAIGFKKSKIKVLEYSIDNLHNYDIERNIPSLEKTSDLGPHLRFGTVSIRQLVLKLKHNEVFFNELIWREFFMQILYNFPKVIDHNFKAKYDFIEWRNNKEEFEKWKTGTTGYPFVDAGIRELNATGYMHNRVRMIVAGFLTKHLLIDWKWGESYFAEKLLDYELSSNNGNWQWSAGTGCDSAPYFRIFNPTEQIKKFDPKLKYIRKWIPEFDSLEYPLPMVDHKFARERALRVYKEGLAKNS
jgi:deoxyribodipyrimidine photo-lyase